MGARGPKPKGGYGDKTAVLSTRITAPTRRALEDAAAKSGRSLSSEVEYRLRRSFGEVENTIDQLGGPQLFAILRMISATMEMTGRHAYFAHHGKISASVDWLYDAYSYDQVVKTVTTILESLRPPGDPEPLAADPAKVVVVDGSHDDAVKTVDWIRNNIGAGMARYFFSMVEEADPTQPLPNEHIDKNLELAQRIAEGLEPVLKSRKTAPDEPNSKRGLSDE